MPLPWASGNDPWCLGMRAPMNSIPKVAEPLIREFAGADSWAPLLRRERPAVARGSAGGQAGRFHRQRNPHPCARVLG